MSWPQWAGGGVPQPAVVQASLLNPAPSVVNPAASLMPTGQYTPEQWAQMQHQNWQQWAQWQQQFQQWQQQYGAEYQKSISAMATQARPTPVQPPVPFFNATTGGPPPLPVESKPPPPPDDPQTGQSAGAPQFPSFGSAPPPVPQSSYNASQPPQPPPPKEPYQSQFGSVPPLLQGGFGNRPGNDDFTDDNNQRFGGGNQNYPNNRNSGRNSNWQQNQHIRNQQQGFGDRFNQPSNFPDESKNRGEFGGKRSYNQPDDGGDVKRNKLEPNAEPRGRWEGNQQKPRWDSPSNPPEKSRWGVKPPEPTPVPAVKHNPEELSEAEKKFDKQFADWESQFQKWKEQNANHPDKGQYREYEKKWEAWRSQLLDRREQMRRKRLGLGSASPQPAEDTLPQAKSDPLHKLPLGTPPSGNAQENAFIPPLLGLKLSGAPQLQIGPQSQFASTTKPGLLGIAPHTSKMGTPPPLANMAKPSLLGSGPPNHQHFGNRAPLLATPTSAPIGASKAPLNLNDQPLVFKKSFPEFADGSRHHPSDHDDRGDSFLKSASADGIPGLDLVKEGGKDDGKGDEDDVPEEKPKGPDLEAISRGINSILGDQMLMNMLSLVSQNQNRPPPAPAMITTIAPVKVDSPKFSPEDPPPNDDYEDNPDYYEAKSQQDMYSNTDEQTRSSFNVPHDADGTDFDRYGKGSDYFEGKPDEAGGDNHDFPHDDFEGGPGNNWNRDNFRGPNDFNRGPGNFNRGGGFDRGHGGFNRGPDSFNRGPDNFNRGPPDDFNRGPDSLNRGPGNFRGPQNDFNRGPPSNFNRGLEGFTKGPDDFNRGPDKFNRGPDNFNRGPDNFNNRGPDNFNNRGSGNFNNRGPDNFNNRGPDNFNNRGPDNFNNRGPDNFSNRGPDNFNNRDPNNFNNRGSGHFNRGSDHFDDGPDNFNDDGDNFEMDPDDFNQPADNFNKGPDRFNKGPNNFSRNNDNFNRGPGNFNRNDFNRGSDNFNRDSDDFDRGADFNEVDLDNFDRELDNFGKGAEEGPKRFNSGNFDGEPERFGREGDGFNRNPSGEFDEEPNRLDGGQDNFNRGPPNFGRGQPNFDKNRFGRGPDNLSEGKIQIDKFQPPPIAEWNRTNLFSKDTVPAVSQIEEPPEEAIIQPAQDEIWKPTTVIDYDHKSLKPVDPDIILEPVYSFDYRHKPLNRIPYPQRPRWLSNMVKNYPEFDTPVARPFEQQLRRYPTNERFESRPPGDGFQELGRQFHHDRNSFEGRDRKLFENRDRNPFEARDQKPFENRDLKPFEARDRKPFEDRGRKPFEDRDRKPFDDSGRKSFDDRDRKPYDEHDRKPYSDWERKSHGHDGSHRKPFDRSDDRRPRDFGDRRLLDDQKFDGKKPHGREADAYGADAEGSKREKEENKVVPAKTVPSKSNVTLIEDLLSPPGRFNRPPRVVIIIRGPPGSGKSFLAKLIKDKEVENGGSAPRILCLDDYFMVEQEKEVEEDGRKVKVKEMVYEYEECMEASYRQSLMKSFKKTITDGYFNFIIVDNINDKVKFFGEMWSFAKQNGFQVYICQLELDVQTCTKRNIHARSEVEIERCVAGWEHTPSHHPTLDATSLIQAGSIPEVEMEEINSPPSESMNEEREFLQEHLITSKWDTFDNSVDNLAKLDGTNKPLRASRTMEDYLQLDDDWVQPVSTKPGQKRVRWADLEERKKQEKMRAIGFVVGQTNWDRMMDPTMGSGALTQTKYIERYS